MKVWKVQVNDGDDFITVEAKNFIEAGKKALKYAKQNISETAEIEMIALLAETDC
jgi:hypothetical protein